MTYRIYCRDCELSHDVNKLNTEEQHESLLLFLCWHTGHNCTLREFGTQELEEDGKSYLDIPFGHDPQRPMRATPERTTPCSVGDLTK